MIRKTIRNIAGPPDLSDDYRAGEDAGDLMMRRTGEDVGGKVDAGADTGSVNAGALNANAFCVRKVIIELLFRKDLYL